MKFFSHLLCLTYIALLFFASTTYAAVTDYLIVDDLPFIGKTPDLSSYLNGLFKLGLGAAVMLAIVFGVINGIQYMFSEIPGVKGASKNRLWIIIQGLILAFACWLILYTINPNFIKFDLVTSLEEAANEAARDIPPPALPQGPGPGTAGSSWPDDSSARATLLAAGITVNRSNCTTIGQKGCTSVYGLSRNAIEGLINLKARCDADRKRRGLKDSCTVEVTGATEYWLHSSHGDNRTVDLGNRPSLTNYLGGQGNKCFDPKQKDGLTFYWEDRRCGSGVAPHWHVKF